MISRVLGPCIEPIQKLPEPGGIEKDYIGEKNSGQRQEKKDEIQEKDAEAQQHTVCEAHGFFPHDGLNGRIDRDMDKGRSLLSFPQNQGVVPNAEGFW